ncbi:MAG: hypothetical protein JWO94_3755 [Verrucomicrobiaceae bacterium]|nr:hypothetical protein [Verrucomicrobiaceae bacterium]
MTATVHALHALSQIRDLVFEIGHRELQPQLRGFLLDLVSQLKHSVAGEACALRQAREIEKGLHEGFAGNWPQGDDQLDDIIHNAHALSGYLLGLPQELRNGHRELQMTPL